MLDPALLDTYSWTWPLTQGLLLAPLKYNLLDFLPLIFLMLFCLPCCQLSWCWPPLPGLLPCAGLQSSWCLVQEKNCLQKCWTAICLHHKVLLPSSCCTMVRCLHSFLACPMSNPALLHRTLGSSLSEDCDLQSSSVCLVLNILHPWCSGVHVSNCHWWQSINVSVAENAANFFHPWPKACCLHHSPKLFDIEVNVIIEDLEKLLARDAANLLQFLLRIPSTRCQELGDAWQLLCVLVASQPCVVVSCETIPSYMHPSVQCFLGPEGKLSLNANWWLILRN